MTKTHLPAAWLPPAHMTHIVVHWTAGTNAISDLDLAHYHFLIDGAGAVHRGRHSIKDNESPLRGDYAAHCLNFNGGGIGVSLCGMVGAQENPFRAGPHPINETQWQIAAEVVAQLCQCYRVPVTYTGVLQHGEVEANTGIHQRGKWDCMRLPWKPSLMPGDVARDFRLRVKAALEAAATTGAK